MSKSKILSLIAIVLSILALLGVFPGLAFGKFSQQAGGSPTVVSYQGQVMASGEPFEGTGYFKFAIVDAAGTASYWSNDGTSGGGGEPTSSVSLPVTQGLFNVLLGDTTLTGMSVSLEKSVFSDPNTLLRVWFSEDGQTFTQLSDQKIASVPYALQAESAANADALGGLSASDYQLQITGSCPVGYAVRAVNSNGSVVCEVASARPGFSITDYGDPTTNAGDSPSVAIGVDSLGLVAYRQRPGNNLVVGHCQDVACTSMSVTEHPASHPAGNYASLAIGSDGLGLIAHRSANDELLITHCNNVACTSADTILVDGGHPGGTYPSYGPSLTIGTDGYGLIAYAEYPERIKVAHCTNPDCSTSEINIVDNGYDFGWSTAIGIGPDGLALIAFSHGDPLRLMVAHCENIACSTSTIRKLHDTGSTGQNISGSITVGSDGLPLISFDFSSTLYIAHCHDPSCSAADFYQIDVPNAVEETSFVIGPDGRGIIGYYNKSDNSLYIAYCLDVMCSSANVYMIDEHAAVDTNSGLGLTIGTDGLPLIAYSHDDGSVNHLKIMHCSNRFCLPHHREW